MNSALMTGAVVGVGLLVTFAIILRSLVATRQDVDGSSVLSEVRVEKYRPMARLLSAEDLEFLKRQAGYTPEIGRRYRVERRRVMRAYLKALSADFATLHAAASHLLMVAPVDQPALANELMKQRWLFTRGMALAHLNLCLDAVGVGQVQVGSLVESLSSVQRQYSSLSEAVVLSSAA